MNCFESVAASVFCGPPKHAAGRKHFCMTKVKKMKFSLSKILSSTACDANQNLMMGIWKNWQNGQSYLLEALP